LQGPASGRESLVGTQSGDSILLEGVSRHHAGEYQCSAHNGVGSLASADLSLTVLCKYNIHLGWARYHAGEYQCSTHNGVDSLAVADLSLTVLCEYNIQLGWSILPVFRIRIQIQIRIHMFLGLSDPDLDPQSEVWFRIRFIKKK